MKVEVRQTNDGSTTLYVPELNEHYHSVHGALQESLHVFIQAGLAYFLPRQEELRVLEIGFGTGLNALLTLQQTQLHRLPVHFDSLEKYPLSAEVVRELRFEKFILNPELLHLFLPISRQKEIDTWPLIDRLRQEHPAVSLAVPVSDFQLTHMTSFLLWPDTPLLENRWGIPEPVGAEEVPPEAIDMVLLPLLTFDLQGHRVGYGKGFYDRFLARCRPDVQKVGLSLEPPVPQISDPNPFDVSLDAAVTPERVYWFRN